MDLGEVTMEPIIVIPTYRRPVELQTSFGVCSSLGISSRFETVAVVAKDETEECLPPAGFKRVVCPVQGNIGKTRQWIIDKWKDRLVFFWDDDIKSLSARFGDIDMRYVAGSKDTKLLHKRLDEFLTLAQHNAEVALAERFLVNTRPLIEVNRKLVQMFCINPRIAKAHKMRFIDDYAQDIDFAIQAAATGAGNALYAGVCFTAAPTQIAGGCSVERTMERLVRIHDVIERRHPGLAFRKTKKLKQKWADGTDEMSVVSVKWAAAPMPHNLKPNAPRKFQTLRDYLKSIK